MQPKTVSEVHERVVPALCVRNDLLDDLDIRGHCFWLGLLYEGALRLAIGNETVEAIAPAFICFDEQESPRLVERIDAVCDSIYFDPTYININMSFAKVHSAGYAEIAAVHDLFSLTPFTDTRVHCFPLLPECIQAVKQSYAGMEKELKRRADWYWSCRSRSYFMELLFHLDRAYAYDRHNPRNAEEEAPNLHLKRAILYIDSHFPEHINLSDIVTAAVVNHTTLTQLFKEEVGDTPMAYLWARRVEVARKFLAFTALPVKDIASRCGFKTVQHFSRKFEALTGFTPTAYREYRLRERREMFGRGYP